MKMSIYCAKESFAHESPEGSVLINTCKTRLLKKKSENSIGRLLACSAAYYDMASATED